MSINEWNVFIIEIAALLFLMSQKHYNTYTNERETNEVHLILPSYVHNDFYFFFFNMDNLKINMVCQPIIQEN